MSDDDKIIEKPQDQTYGTGEQYVLEPTGPQEKQKARSEDELPEKILTTDGKVVNLDTCAVTSDTNIIELCGRKIDLKEFGPAGEAWIMEMYEGWLGAVQDDLVSTFCTIDEGGVDSSKIVDILKERYPYLVGRIVWRQTLIPVLAGGDGKMHPRGYLKWDRNTTFEEWMQFTVATMRWRIGYEIDSRRIRDGLSIVDIMQAKGLLEQYLIVAEKWLQMPESARLVSV